MEISVSFVMSRETFQKVMLEGDEVRELDFEDHEEFEVKYPSIIDYLSMKDRLAGSIEYEVFDVLCETEKEYEEASNFFNGVITPSMLTLN